MEPLYVYQKEPEEEIMFVPEDYGQPEDIGYGYQKSALSSELANFKEHYPYLSNEELEKLMLDYLEKGRPKDNYYIYGKTKKSVFRERDENEHPDRLQHMTKDETEENYKPDAMLKNQSPFRERFREVDSKENNRHMNNADLEYLSALNTLWEQYQHKQDFDNEEEDEESNDIDRNDNVELSEDDIAAILSYFEDKSDDDQRQIDENYEHKNEAYPVVYLKNDKYAKHHIKSAQKRIWRDGPFDSYAGYDNSDKFMIKKRSLGIKNSDLKRKHQATEVKPKDQTTDKELNKIFGEGGKKNKTSEKSDSSKTSTTKDIETPSTTARTTLRPIIVKKKSVDWSDYFGIDKRKKKSFNRKRANNDWLIEQYMNQHEMARGPTPIDIDSKFLDMEDAILDQLIKYTGAHEGVRNPEQLRQIKQKILTQLAAAYSLEKMRRALDEYRSTVDAQNLDNNSMLEKRVALKKDKEAKDSGVTLEEDGNNASDSTPHEKHVKKSFFRRNSAKFLHGLSI